MSEVHLGRVVNPLLIASVCGAPGVLGTYNNTTCIQCLRTELLELSSDSIDKDTKLAALEQQVSKLKQFERFSAAFAEGVEQALVDPIRDVLGLPLEALQPQILSVISQIMEALRFYAEEDSWIAENDWGIRGANSFAIVDRDQGHIARKALNLTAVRELVPPEQLVERVKAATNSLELGWCYRHKNTGSLYVLTGLAFRESDLKLLAVYSSHGITFTRPLTEFVHKFSPVSQRDGSRA